MAVTAAPGMREPKNLLAKENECARRVLLQGFRADLTSRCVLFLLQVDTI